MIVALPELADSLGAPAGLLQRRLGDLELGLRFSTDPPTLMLEPLPSSHPVLASAAAPQAADRRPPATRFSCWFAWYALQDPPPAP
jgi:hypothetical protein